MRTELAKKQIIKIEFNQMIEGTPLLIKGKIGRN